MLFFLLLIIAILAGIVLYQQFAFRRGTQASLKVISRKLKEINETDSLAARSPWTARPM